MCGKCDNIEGNLCRACEGEMREVKNEVANDGMQAFQVPPPAPASSFSGSAENWWPMVAVGARSINIASTVAAAQLGVVDVVEMLYV